MLEIANARFAYADRVAVRDVSLAIGETELVALAGPNGSGKSTLLKLVARVAAPQSGEVRFLGRPLAEWNAKAYAQQIGYLPQEPETSFPMRAIDVVVSGRAPFLTRFGVEGEHDYREAAAALDLCDGSHLAERYLDEMSGGERKRVFLARVLAGKPKLILLDEPLAALDVAHTQQFSRLLRDIVDRTRATVVFASHDLNWAAAYSDRIVVMQDGTIAADLPPAELMRPDVVRRFFGFDAEAVSVDGKPWLVPRV
ncbi:MAG TPA: ABC transporter ATP-binding protein [Thermoanaerobaculia bacterium]|nr:ABC transporter ATP-binding protein [Thermoanaerobaculia bacterium]